MTYEGTKFFDPTRLGHNNCLDKCLDETRNQDITFETKTKTKTKAVTLKTKAKTKTVEILSRDCLETRQCLETSHHC